MSAPYSINSLFDPVDEVDKEPTGIPGFDFICYGGLTRGRLTLLSGTAGAGKTIFASQFLAGGIQEGRNGVFVTFEESVEDIRRNTRGLGFPIEQWEAESKWAFVDGSLADGERAVEAGAFDLGGLISRIEYAVKRVDAVRVSLDSLGALFNKHDKAIREFTIDHEGMHLGNAFRNVAGIISGNPRQMTTDEVSRIERLFDD